MYFYLDVVTINDKIDLKFCLTMATKKSHKEVALKTKYEALKELEGGRTSRCVSNKLLLVPFQLRKNNNNFLKSFKVH